MSRLQTARALLERAKRSQRKDAAILVAHMAAIVRQIESE